MRLTAAIIVIFLAIGTTYAVKKIRSDGVAGEPVLSETRTTGTGDAGDAGCACCSKGPEGSGIGDIRRQAAYYYMNAYRDTDFQVTVKDFGCHQEAYISKDGRVVKTLSISGGRITEAG